MVDKLNVANNYETTLASGISNSATSIEVVSATGSPSTPFMLTLSKTEIVKVTAKSGTTFTIQRAQEGTSAITHNAGANVEHTWTAGNADNIFEYVDEHKADYASFITNNINAKNSIYRGKYLGSSVTAAQYTAISDGTFEDMYIGDYWTISGVNYRIAAFDYYYNTGDTACTTHHVVIVPDTYLYTNVMNSTNITTGGYIGSEMYTSGLNSAKATIGSAFSGHVLNHRQLLCNSVINGEASGWAWFDSEVELMNEIMVYGASVFGASSLGGASGYNIGIDKSQLPLFALNPLMTNTRQTFWLRDVVSASDFALVSYYGHASRDAASNSHGVCPAFSIS